MRGPAQFLSATVSNPEHVTDPPRLGFASAQPLAGQLARGYGLPVKR